MLVRVAEWGGTFTANIGSGGYSTGSPSKIDLLQLLEPFVEFVDGFGGISQREILVQHDQEILASVGVALEKSTNCPGKDAASDA